MTSWKMLVYGLVDPRTGRLRYVGKSSDGKRRPRAHWGKIALERGKAPCDSWVRKLVSLGLRPVIETLEDLGSLEKTEENKQLANSLLNSAEMSWIAFTKATGNELLNCTLGGDGLLGRKHMAQTLEAIGKARRSRRSGMLGKRHSEEARDEMRLSQLRRFGRVDDDGNIIPKKERLRTGRSGVHNSFFGKRHSPETRLIMRLKAQNRTPEWRQGMSDMKSKSVRCLDDGRVFRSAREASAFYDISASSIHACARGERKSGRTRGKAFIFEDSEG